MHRRARGPRLQAAAAVILLGACSGPDSAHPVPTTAEVIPTTTTTTTPPTAAVDPGGPGPFGVEIYLPTDPVGAPVTVLVHGGGWLAGAPRSMEPLGRALAERGAVVFNSSYRTDSNGGGYPATFEDVACAVSFARHTAEGLGATGPLSIVGHSAGAHIATVVASAADGFGPGCRFDESSVPDRVVGLAGIYRLEAVGPIMERFLGGDAGSAPEAWEAADPFLHIDALVAVEFLLVHGTADRIASPTSSQQLADALVEAGATVDLHLIEGGTHNGVIDPAVVAGLVVP